MSRERSEDDTMLQVGAVAPLGPAVAEVQDEKLRAVQTQLESSRSRYRKLFDEAPVAYLRLDPESTIGEANEAAARLLGVNRSELVGRAFSTFMDDANADSLRRHLVTCCDEGHATSELSLGLDRGARRPVRIDSVTVESNGGPGSCLMVVTDLTALRTSEDRFALLSETVPEVFFTHVRAERRFDYVSPAFEMIWGRTPAELYAAGSGWIEWVHSADRAAVTAAYDQLLEGVLVDVEYRVLHPDGTVRWVHTRTFPVAANDVHTDLDVGLTRDITLERTLRSELQHAQKLEAMGTMVGGVAHDFNNLLQGILGVLSIAGRESTAPERAREYVGRAAQAAKRGGELVGQLMSYSRKSDEPPEPVRLDLVVARVGGLIDRLVTEWITVTVTSGAPSAHVRAEVAQLERVLMNLAVNARDAMPKGGALDLRTDLEQPSADVAERLELTGPRYVRLVVSDDGEGMDAETRARIFEPYFTTKPPGEGTGLGLATVCAVVRELGGGIDVETAPGEGTTFLIWLPVAD